MTEQTIIVGNRQLDFQDQVKEHFKQGWKVVPGTVAASLSSGVANSGLQVVNQVFVIVLERPIPTT